MTADILYMYTVLATIEIEMALLLIIDFKNVLKDCLLRSPQSET